MAWQPESVERAHELLNQLEGVELDEHAWKRFGSAVAALREAEKPKLTQLRLAMRLDKDPSWVSKIEAGGIQRLENVVLLQETLSPGGHELIDALLGRQLEGSRLSPSLGTYAHEVRREVLVWASRDPVEVWERIWLRAGPDQIRFEWLFDGDVESSTKAIRPRIEAVFGGWPFSHVGEPGHGRSVVTFGLSEVRLAEPYPSLTVVTSYPADRREYWIRPLDPPPETVLIQVQLPEDADPERVNGYAGLEATTGAPLLTGYRPDGERDGKPSIDRHGLATVGFRGLRPGLQYGIGWPRRAAS